MNFATLEDMGPHFQNKLTGIKSLLELQNAADDEDVKLELERTQSLVEDIGIVLTLLREQVANERGQLANYKKTGCDMEQFAGQIEYSLKNVPIRMPKPHAAVSDSSNNNQSNHKATEVANGAPEAANERKVQVAAPVETNKPRPVKKQTEGYFPEVEYLTVEEFNGVPKYQRGRLSYNQINGMVEELNTSFKSKYRLMRQKRSTMNDASRKKFEKYKMQETKDTKGMYFIVDEDIKEFTSRKMDSVARSILTILRHCGRIREIRGGNLTRYAYVDSY